MSHRSDMRYVAVIVCSLFVAGFVLVAIAQVTPVIPPCGKVDDNNVFTNCEKGEEFRFNEECDAFRWCQPWWNCFPRMTACYDNS